MNTVTATTPKPSPILKIVQAEDERTLATRLDKLRIAEALTARDHAVRQMEALCTANRSKGMVIAKLQQEKAELEARLEAARTISAGPVPGILRVNLGGSKQGDEDMMLRLQQENADLKTKIDQLVCQFEAPQPPLNDSAPPALSAPASPSINDELRSPPIDIHSPLFSNPPEFTIQHEADAVTQARYAILADLPIPPEIPTDTLTPIVIPPPHTLQDFLGTASDQLKAQLSNVRIFQDNTTFWCPDREEHGYYVTPTFKCNTNPRVTTAHRWIVLDLAPGVDRSTECFYTKDGKWYYAGVYKTFRLRDITAEEWTQLPAATTQALVKETLSLRKNTSPQNIYETGQLYAAGALKAACIGLQCIGFNEDLYRSLLALAHECSKTGRWKVSPSGLGNSLPMWSPTISPRLSFEAGRTTIGLDHELGLGSGSVPMPKELGGTAVEKILSP